MHKPPEIELRTCSDCDQPMTERGQDRIEGLRQFQAHGRCTRCYQVALQAGELTARVRANVSDTEIECMKCQLWKPKSAFKTSSNTTSGYEYTCRACGKLWERYGITAEQYLALFELQNGECAICLRPVAPFTRNAHVDHDHSCCTGKNIITCGKCIRGILCGPCNAGLGMFSDNVTSLKKAINYLEKSKNMGNDLFARSADDAKDLPEEKARAKEQTQKAKDSQTLHAVKPVDN